MASLNLNLVVIRSRDLSLAKAFYQALGVEFDCHRHGSGPEHLAWEKEGVTFEIYPESASRPATSATRIGFAVEDIEEILEQVIASGGRIVQEPQVSPWGLRAVVTDLDGHKIELTAPAKP